MGAACCCKLSAEHKALYREYDDTYELIRVLRHSTSQSGHTTSEQIVTAVHRAIELHKLLLDVPDDDIEQAPPWQVICRESCKDPDSELLLDPPPCELRRTQLLRFHADFALATFLATTLRVANTRPSAGSVDTRYYAALHAYAIAHHEDVAFAWPVDVLDDCKFFHEGRARALMERPAATDFHSNVAQRIAFHTYGWHQVECDAAAERAGFVRDEHAFNAQRESSSNSAGLFVAHADSAACEAPEDSEGVARIVCVICRVNTITHSFPACSHVCVCVDCANTMVARASAANATRVKCPMCQKLSPRIARAYIVESN